MFTGIVETTGVVSSITSSPQGSSTLVVADSAEILGDAHEGDSISVNGTCLTITTFSATDFTLSVSPETLRRTNLGDLRIGERVNLERAVSASTRLGGHFVQGHVDTVAEIVQVQPDGDCLTFRLRPSRGDVLHHVVEKGYVTLDGASLTITRVDDRAGWFEVMLITYTQDKVIMSQKGAGGRVNVEVDMVGKYVEKSIHGWMNSMLEAPHDDSPLAQLVSRVVKKALD